jgi:TRAP-type uncharacterized transport system substrate-binding protein/ABC-type amino acid transport system permease subunit
MSAAWSDFAPDFLMGLIGNFGAALGSLLLGGLAGGGLAVLRFRGGWAGRAAASATGLLRASPTFVIMFFLLNVIPAEVQVFGTGIPFPPMLILILALSVYSSAYVSDNLLDTLRHWEGGSPAAALLFIPNMFRAFVVLTMASSTGAAIGVREAVTTTIRYADRMQDTGSRVALVLAVILFFATLMQFGRIATAKLTGFVQEIAGNQAATAPAHRTAFGWLYGKATYGWIAAAVLFAFMGGGALAPLPPTSITIATGPVDGSWYQTFKIYRDYLEARGIKVNARVNDASSSIIDDVNQPESGVDGGFVLHDANPAAYSNTMALGQIDYQPLFVFVRADAGPVDTVTALRGKRIGLPPADSVTSHFALPVLSAFGVTEANSHFSFEALPALVEAIETGKADAAFMLMRSDSPVIAKLAMNPGLRMLNFHRAAALLQRFPELRSLVIPASTYDLERNVPSADVRLIATSSQVVVRKDLHPAIVYLLLEAMTASHRGATIVSKDGEFPALRGGHLPVADYVSSYYLAGVPWIYKNLPRWLASIVGYYMVLIVPVAVLLPLYNWLALPKAPDLIVCLRSVMWVHTLRGYVARLEAGGTLTRAEVASLHMIQVALNKPDRTSDCRQALARIAELRHPPDQPPPDQPPRDQPLPAGQEEAPALPAPSRVAGALSGATVSG